MKRRSNMVTVTMTQLRKGLIAMLGEKSQVTVQSEQAFDGVLPGPHWGIAWREWEAAAAAEGLEIERDGPIDRGGFTFWRQGSQKQPVPAAALPATSAIAPPAASGQAAPAPMKPIAFPPKYLDPTKVAAQARQYMEEQDLAGRPVELQDAIAHVVAASGGVWGPNAGEDTNGTAAPPTRPRAELEREAIALSRRAADIMAAEHTAGRPCSSTEATLLAMAPEYGPEALRQAAALLAAEHAAGRECTVAEALARILEPREGIEAQSRKLQDYVAAQRAAGRTISVSQAADELGLRK
jgi:hypothetical protein